MNQVWKYKVPLTDNPVISMPKGAMVLHFGVQRGEPCIWVLVNPTAEIKPRQFRLVGTGRIFEDSLFDYIGTVLMTNDNLVWHLFEPTRLGEL